MIFVRKGQVTVEADFTPGTGAGYVAVGCLAGDLNVPRSASPGTTELDNWCVGANGSVQQVTLGETVIEPTMTLEMDPSLPAYGSMNQAFNDRDEINLKIVATDDNGSTHTLEYRVAITNFDLNFRGAQGATSQGSLTFHVQEIITDTINAQS